jgi:hypothetical protein
MTRTSVWLCIAVLVCLASILTQRTRVAAAGSSSTSNFLQDDDAVASSGTPPKVHLLPTSLGWSCMRFRNGSPCVCTHYPPAGAPATLTNEGPTILNITSITTTGFPFKINSTTCTQHLGVFQSCTIYIGWEKVTGKGRLSVTDNAADSPQIVQLGAYIEPGCHAQ